MRNPFRLLLLGATLALVASPGVLAAQETQDKGPAEILLTGASLGGVIFRHASHQDMTDCSSCHHESKEEKPLEQEHQACTVCHVKSPMPPMTTSVRDAFHDKTGKSGVCVDCHVKEAEAGKTVPLKCTECHMKENVAPGS